MQAQGVLFGQIAAVFGIVIAGVWGATQWTAAALGYQLRLGSPWFDFFGTPVFLPWGLFEWWFFFDAYAPQVFDTGGMIAASSGLLAVVVWAELRGEDRVNVGPRQIPPDNQRQALAVVLVSVLLVAVSTFVLLAETSLAFEEVLFEVVSAFGTVGLSTGITADLPQPGQLLLIVLMFVGRIGPITLASALALRQRGRRYELPMERINVG